MMAGGPSGNFPLLYRWKLVARLGEPAFDDLAPLFVHMVLRQTIHLGGLSIFVHCLSFFVHIQ
jgi:hypothetical protein